MLSGLIHVIPNFIHHYKMYKFFISNEVSKSSKIQVCKQNKTSFDIKIHSMYKGKDYIIKLKLDMTTLDTIRLYDIKK